MNRSLITIAASLLATVPALTHEIAATHAHAGPVVLMELPQALLLGAGALTLLAIAVYAATRVKKQKVRHHDPR